MVKVNIIRHQGQIQSVEISGHANSGPYGHDLVCAAVSAVSIGTYNAIEVLCKTELPAQQGGTGGYLYFVVPLELEQERAKCIQLLLEGMLVSMQTIEAEYHQYIEIYDEGGGSYVET